ncbi:MAG: dihydropteroate synthase [Bacteroidia bacterium]
MCCLFVFAKIDTQTELQTLFRKITLNCKGKLLSLEYPVIMGILNVTSDSFYDGGKYSSMGNALTHAGKMLKEGAAIIDIGGYSSRPGAEEISLDEELKRTIPVIESVAERFPEAILSIDTFRSTVAFEAVNAGAHIVNDISAGDDDEMISTVAKLKVPFVMMHKKGSPKTMQQDPHYENVTQEVMNYFTRKIALGRSAGIIDLIIDPGFGFGKKLNHNYQLLHSLNDFQIFGLPILAGISRKKMIQQVTGTSVADALNGTSAANTIALVKGANILRVHDVKEAVECVNIVKATHGII